MKSRPHPGPLPQERENHSAALEPLEAFRFEYFPLGCLAGLFCLASGLFAADAPLQITRNAVTLPEIGVVTNCVVSTALGRVVFIPPDGSKLEAEGGGGGIKVTPPDQQSHILLRFPKSPTVSLSGDPVPELRQQIESRYPGAQISDGRFCYSGAGRGWFFDIRRTTEFKTSLTTRHAFLPLSGGLAEVSMTTTTTNFPAQSYRFAHFLASLKIGAPEPVASTRH